MKILKSDRDIDLVSDFDAVTKYPCVSVEKHNKWNSLYLVTEDHEVFNIENEVNATPSRSNTFSPEFIRIWNDCVLQGDHCWCPAHVCDVLKAFNMYIGVWAYAALVMMWVEQHIEQPGFEIDYLPSVDLYRSVVTPDTEYEPIYSDADYLLNMVRKPGDISLCNSFTEEERKQFRYYVPNPKIPDDFILREISSVNKKTEYPSYKKQELLTPEETKGIISDLKSLSDKYGVVIETCGQKIHPFKDFENWGMNEDGNPILLDKPTPHPGASNSLVNISDHSVSVHNEGDAFARVMRYRKPDDGSDNDTDDYSDITDYKGLLPIHSEEAIKELEKIASDVEIKSDIESAHIKADQVLCDLLTKLGYALVIEKWDAIDKWYS